MKMMRPDGFTMIEMVIVTSTVFTLVGGVIFVLTASSTDVWARTDAKLTSLAAAQRALNRASEDLLKACQSTVACSAGGLTFKQPAPAASTCEASDPEITYTLAGGTLTRQVGTGVPPAVIAVGLTAFNSTCGPGELVGVQVAARSSTLGRPSAQTVESLVWVRTP